MTRTELEALVLAAHRGDGPARRRMHEPEVLDAIALALITRSHLELELRAALDRHNLTLGELDRARALAIRLEAALAGIDLALAP